VFRFSGFRDGHSHPLFASRESSGPHLDAVATADRIVETLRAYLVEHPQTAWLDCGSYQSMIESDLDRALLDRVSDTVPIVVHRVDHHAICVNSAALETAGYSDSAPLLSHASFDLDNEGRPTGIIREWDAMNLIYAHQPPPTLESDLAALERAQQTLLSKGIVAVQDAWIDPGMELPYLAAAKSGALKLRFNLAPRIDTANWQESLRYAKGLRSDVRATANALLTVNTVKVFLDGVFGSNTAWVSNGNCIPATATGLWVEQELLKMALAADSAGFQLHFHCVGDEAFSQALRVAEHLEMTNGWVDRRLVIAHADLISTAQIEQARRLGVIVCAQPSWAGQESSFDEAARIVGSDADRLYPLRSLTDAGVRLSFGSDWPVSAPNPIDGILGATSGHLRQGESITVMAALRAYSEGTAHQLAQETLIGDDSVVLSADPLACSPAELAAIRVLKVTVAGTPVWGADH